MHQMCEVLLLFTLLKKVTLEPESTVLVLKTSCCSPFKIYSSLALLTPEFLYFSVASTWQCLTLEDKEYSDQSQNFHLCFLNEFPHCLTTVTRSNEIDMVLNTINVSLLGFSFICCIKYMGFASGHIRRDT